MSNDEFLECKESLEVIETDGGSSVSFISFLFCDKETT